MGQLSARGTIPTPTKFIKQVTISMHIALEVTSWYNWAEYMMGPTIQTGPCSSANSGGMPVTTQATSSLCRDHAISTNPGRVDGHWWMVPSHFGSTSWAAAVGLLTIWAVVEAFGCPSLYTAKNIPLACTWHVLLLLCSLVVGSTDLVGVILTQLDDWRSSKTSSSVTLSGAPSHIEAPVHFLPFSKVCLGWWLGFFCPMLEGLSIGQGLLWLLQPKTLSSKLHILSGQEMVPV